MPRRTVVFGAESLSLSSSFAGGFDLGAALTRFAGRTGEESDSESDATVFAFPFPVGGPLELASAEAAGLALALEGGSVVGVRVLTSEEPLNFVFVGAGVLEATGFRSSSSHESSGSVSLGTTSRWI